MMGDFPSRIDRTWAEIEEVIGPSLLLPVFIKSQM